MTNREKFKEEICDIAIARKNLAVSKKFLKPCMCDLLNCSDCIAGENVTSCEKIMEEWANSEYVEPCPFEKDELVEVSDNGKQWALRYFSHQEGRYAYFYEFGLTSKETTDTCSWNYCHKYGTLGGLVKEVNK